MRISDWSSDVCSSDLDPELPPEKLITAGGEIIHELGTARMGPDPRSSVVDSYGQTWEVGNLVLMDGAIFASGAHKNPTLTILALALRASERLAARFRTRSEEHTSELQSLMRNSYAVCCLKKKNKTKQRYLSNTHKQYKSQHTQHLF